MAALFISGLYHATIALDQVVRVSGARSEIFVKTAETVLRMVSFDAMGPPHDRSVAILVVEDEFLIRMDTASFLESVGFIVFEAEHADEAIRRLERHEEIRLIFTDVNMPGSMNGLALAHYVRGRWPPVGIIVTSGVMKAGADSLPENALFVEKPYVLKNIAEKINELLAA